MRVHIQYGCFSVAEECQKGTTVADLMHKFERGPEDLRWGYRYEDIVVYFGDALLPQKFWDRLEVRDRDSILIEQNRTMVSALRDYSEVEW